MKLGLTAVASCCLVHLGLVGGLIAGAVPLAVVAVAVGVAVVALSRHRRGSRAHCC